MFSAGGRLWPAVAQRRMPRAICRAEAAILSASLWFDLAGEEHPVPLADQFLRDSLQHVRLAASWIAKYERIFRTLQKPAIEQCSQLAGGFGRQSPNVECLERFVERKPRFSQHLCGSI